MNMADRQTHSDLEKRVQDYWDEHSCFQKSIEQRSEGNPYVFYDGPPFATGLPHYGHMVPTLMKDVVPRFWTMKGFRVERKWGWDCHGLPIENLVEKEHDMSSKKDIEEMGVAAFNDACRSKVLMYVDDWKVFIRRIGRWVDMENDYKTMDLNFMESVWWVFKQIWEKDMIYEAFKSMHVCPRCETVLSQSEVSQGYEDVEDASVIWRFPLVGEERTSLLAWTTTPWSSVSTMGLSIGPEFTYVKVRVGDEIVIFAKDRLEFVMEGVDDYEVLEEIPGSDLVGLEYLPIVDDLRDHPDVKRNDNVYRTFAGDYVEVTEGTGIVTINGSYGEIDMESAKKNGLPIVMDVDMDGTYNELLPAYQGMNVWEAQEKLIKDMEAQGRVWRTEKYTHSYPHCWRCDSKLLNYATTSWFVRVSEMRDRLTASNQGIHWVPENMKEGRFGKGLADSPDWAISRSRYWGTPLPVWRSEEGEVLCVGSLDELEELSGVRPDDLHKQFVDDIVIEKDGKTYRRIPEVLDCWMEAGSMPYAQLHYPFENRETFDRAFPADFIAEGQDQTRCWFHKLHVISNILFDMPAFKNVIVNGIVLAEDGKKMSKKLQNYPDPMEVMEKYGADAVRYYLMSTPVVRAENLRFAEEGVAEVSRKFINILRNVLSFYQLYSEHDDGRAPSGEHVLDQWILSRLNETLRNETDAFEKYELMHAARGLQTFVTDLSTWYVRRSRDRFRTLASPSPSMTGGGPNETPPAMGGQGGAREDALQALATLRHVLEVFSQMIAPFMPMLAEQVYQSIDGGFEGRDGRVSVHLTDWPEVGEIDQAVIDEMGQVRAIVSRALDAREEAGRAIKQPLASMTATVPSGAIDQGYLDVIADEVNVKEVVVEKGELKVELDTELTPELVREGMLRDVSRKVNQLRKDAGLTISDQIELYVYSDDEEVKKMFEEHADALKESALATSVSFEKKDVEHEKSLRSSEHDIWIGF